MAPRRKNAHYHVPALNVKMGEVIDLTIESNGFRTSITGWDGWQMVCDENAFDQSSGHARMFLVKGELKKQTSMPEDITKGTEAYKQWHDREPEELGELQAPDDIGYLQGRCIQLGYRSDKWNQPGEDEDYDHIFNEEGSTAPKFYTDRAEVDDSSAAIIVGGDFVITEKGID